jgi:hypothetical protein
LVHTARTQGHCPGCLLRKPPDGIDRRLGVGQSVSVFCEGAQWFIAGWSSPVARQAHNLKVTGSNPVPATTFVITRSPSRFNRRDGFSFSGGTVGRSRLGYVQHCQAHRNWRAATDDDEHYVYAIAAAGWRCSTKRCLQINRLVRSIVNDGRHLDFDESLGGR